MQAQEASGSFGLPSHHCGLCDMLCNKLVMEQINPTQSPDCGEPELQEEMQQEVRHGPTPVDHSSKRQRQEDVV